MTFSTIRSASAELPLEHLIERLTRHEHVEAIVLVGSTASGRSSPASDIDIVIVLSDGSISPRGAAHSPFEVAFTFIGDRPADVIITTIEELSGVADEGSPLPHASESLLRWIEEGEIVHDRKGRVTAIVHGVRRVAPRPWTDPERRALWWRANFALVKAKRYSASGDPAYQDSVRWVLNQGLDASLFGYFAARRLPWRGEKDAMQHWAQNDRGFLRAVLELFDSDDRSLLDRYVRVADIALGPLGGLWDEGTGPVSATWESLIAVQE